MSAPTAAQPAKPSVNEFFNALTYPELYFLWQHCGRSTNRQQLLAALMAHRRATPAGYFRYQEHQIRRQYARQARDYFWDLRAARDWDRQDEYLKTLEAGFHAATPRPDLEACVSYFEREYKAGRALERFSPFAVEVVRNLLQRTMHTLMANADLERLSRLTPLWSYFEEGLTTNEATLAFAGELFHKTGLYGLKMPAEEMPRLEAHLQSRYLNLNLRLTLLNFGLSYYIQQRSFDKIAQTLDATLAEFGQQNYLYRADLYRFSLMGFYGRLHTHQLAAAISHYRDSLRLQHMPAGVDIPTHWVGSIRVSLELRDLPAAGQTARRLEGLQDEAFFQYCLLPLTHYYLLAGQYEQAHAYLNSALQHGNLLKSSPHWLKARALQLWLLARQEAYSLLCERYEAVPFRLRLDELTQTSGTAEQYWLTLLHGFYYLAQYKTGEIAYDRLCQKLLAHFNAETFDQDMSFILMGCYLLEELQALGVPLQGALAARHQTFADTVAPLRELVQQIGQA